MINPSKKGEALNSPVERANELNDPQFQNTQGYFNYDLTHSEYITPLFGKITPSMHLDTVPADRVVFHEDVKTILNRIDGNFLNTINQYSDSFFVSLRSVFPTNYEKLIPNPLKGDDLPNSALPMVPLAAFIMDYIRGDFDVWIEGSKYNLRECWRNVVQIAPLEGEGFSATNLEVSYILGRLLLLATVLSRGELLDYLGIQFDYNTINSRVSSVFQEKIDKFFEQLYLARETYLYGLDGNRYFYGIEINTTDNAFDPSLVKRQFRCNTKEEWRQAISDCFEAGLMPSLTNIGNDWSDSSNAGICQATNELGSIITQIFGSYELLDVDSYLTKLDASGEIDLHDGGHINIGKVLAYQQIVAQYYTNDRIDNIFSSELYMQLLRGVMYPSSDGLFTKEPVFDYNGVATEYDYISAGGFWASLISNEIAGKANRQFIWMTLMMLLRRSLRYGDYFSTARIDMLAVSDQLNIATTGSMVSPVDITKGLLMQRYLNAANYIGQGFFDDRITGNVELYWQYTTDLLMQNQGIPTSSGFSSFAWRNVGDMENIGWEFNLNGNQIIKVGKFGMDFNITFANNRNEVTRMDETCLTSLNHEWDRNNGSYLSRVELNHALGSIYGFRYKGVYQYTEYSAEEVPGVSGPNAPVARDKDGVAILDENQMTKPMMFCAGTTNYEFRGGDAIYDDVNHDGSIDELDIVYLGSSLPKFTGGFGFKLKWGRLSWNNQFNFRYGNKVVNKARMNAENMYSNNNQSRAVNWRWRVEGDITSVPRALRQYGYNWLGSDRFVEDGSFIRLNYTQLNYSFDPKVVKQLGINRLSLYLSANNLFCLTKYSGADPEVGYGGMGVSTDNAQTPRAKSFTAGVTVQF